MAENSFYFNPFALISLSSFLIMIILAFLLRSKFYSDQTKYVVFLFVVNAVYSFFYSFEISFKTLHEVIWFYRCEYFGIPFLSTFYLMFVLQFSGKNKWLSKRNKLLLFFIPLITLLMVFTNDHHHLFNSDERMNFSGPFPSYTFTPNIWYYVQQAYVIVNMMLSLIILSNMLKTAAPLYRKQLQFTILAAIFPVLGYLAYQLHLVPFGIDPVSFTFTLTGIMVYIALVRFKLFDLVPIARSNLFEKIQDGVLVFDLNNRLVDYNQAVCDQFIITKTDLGKTTQELLTHWPRVQQFIENNQSGTLEFQHSMDGRIYYYNIQILELENSKKLIQGKLVVIKDVSELIKTERERSYTESKLDAVINAMPDMMFVIDSQGVFTDFFVSDPEKLFLSKEEVLGASLSHLFNPEEAETLMRMLSDSLATNEISSHHYEMNFLGVLKHYEARLSKLDDSHVLAIIRDVTESHEMRTDLLYQSGFQKILMHLASRFIYIAESETDFVINDSLRQIGEYTGIDRCYIFRYDFENGAMSNTHEWCRPGVSSRIEMRQQIGIDQISDWPISHQKGETTQVEKLNQLAPKSPMRTLLESLQIKSILTIPMISQKNCLGFVGFDNIYEMKRWRDSEISSLKIFTGMLANLLEKITIEQSLVEARSKAEASNRLKTAFMNNISHEIRTPLNGIIGFGEIIANEQLSLEEKNKFLTVVQESSERLIQTIDDYLDISMLVTGNQEIHLSHFNLSQLIDEVIEEYSVQAKSKQITISSEVPENLKQTILFSDSTLIRKVFSHLVGNSLKFTEKGIIRIGMTRENNYVAFYVKDSGIGIAQNAQKYIFDSFMQEDFSSTRMYEGSGLGLSIVKGIVTLLGGDITLESIKGEGSTFNIKLPA